MILILIPRFFDFLEKALFKEKLENTALECLCQTFEGVILDAKHFRAHWLFPKLRKMADDGVLIGSTNEGGILANLNLNKYFFTLIFTN